MTTRFAVFALALLAAVGCYDSSSPTEPRLDLYVAICLDSIYAHPFYVCPSLDTIRIVVEIDNPISQSPPGAHR